MNRRGLLYLVSLGIVFFLTIVGASMLMRGLSETHLSERSRNQSAAFHLADAGVDQAAINLRTDTLSDDILTRTLPMGTSSILAVVPLGSQLDQVTVRGISVSEQRDVEAVVQLTRQSVFQFALFGAAHVNIGGDTITDSYSSSLGSYGSQVPGKNGDVGTNATGTWGKGITVTGTSLVVNGQVVVGPDVTDFTTVVTGNVNDDFITGGPPKYVSQPTTFPMVEALTVPPVGCETALPPLIEKTRTFQTAVGAYCPPGDLVVNGGEQLTADGPVKIYLSSQLQVSGNTTVGVVGNPAAMAFLLSSSGGATFQGSLTGTTSFYGVVYGPRASISISGNAEVFGSIIAEDVDLSGDAVIHYDERLTEFTDISNMYATRIISWRELN
jgi:hypothetical protein